MGINKKYEFRSRMTKRKSLPTEAGESQLTMKDMWTSAKRKSESEHMVSKKARCQLPDLLVIEDNSTPVAEPKIVPKVNLPNIKMEKLSQFATQLNASDRSTDTSINDTTITDKDRTKVEVIESQNSDITIDSIYSQFESSQDETRAEIVEDTKTVSANEKNRAEIMISEFRDEIAKNFITKDLITLLCSDESSSDIEIFRELNNRIKTKLSFHSI